MQIRIAGMTIALSATDPSLTPLFAGAAVRFAVPADRAPDVDILVERSAVMPRRSSELLFDSGGAWVVSDDDGRYRIDCTSPVYGDQPYKVAWFDRSFRSGRLLLRADIFEGEADALGYPLDEVLIANLLGRGRGVELHGCGVIEGGRGRLFVGQSGAGKTTTARLWLARGGVEVVSDDRVIVRQIDGEWRMFGTPWHGEAELSSPASAPLDAIYLLQQAPATRVVKISPAEAAARLFGCTFPLFYDPQAIDFALQCLDRIVNDVPVRVLEFTADASVIEAVSNRPAMPQ